MGVGTAKAFVGLSGVTVARGANLDAVEITVGAAAVVLTARHLASYRLLTALAVHYASSFSME